MNNVTMTPARLTEIIARFASARIAVVGDYFLDKYLDVDPSLEEISVETELPAYQVTGIRCFPGAAGTVVSNLSALGAGQLIAIGFAGQDGEAFELRRELQRRNCSIEHLHESTERATPTYLKPRDQTKSGLAGEHSRYDTKNRQPLTRELEQAIITSLDSVISNVDAVIVLDQVEERNHGAINDAVRTHLSQLAQQHSNVIFWADSRRRINEFRYLVTKPNQFETIDKQNPRPGESISIDELKAAALSLSQQNHAPVFVTSGQAGIGVVDGDWTTVPALRLSVEIDPTGAGDSTSAGCVLALSAGASLIEAAIVGNLVASITVQQLATTGTARPDELPAQLSRWLVENA
jgi:rfaE bifunctional protein kinase chain/domain